MGTIAVTGATGTVGSRIVARLADRGEQVRAVSRSPQTTGGSVVAHPADLTDPAQAKRALAGASAVYLTPPLAGDDPTGTETAVCRNVVDAAMANGLEHIVMHSALRANRGDTGARILDNKTPIERAVADSGLGYTIIRPAWFLQNLWAAKDYLAQGVFSMPWPADMVWAATDVDDIANVAFAALERGPSNEAYDLHVPGGVTGAGLAAAATEVLGHEVAYQEAPVSSREFVDAFPISDTHKELYAELFDYFKSTTYLGDPTPVSAAFDGFQPRPIEDFLRDELFSEE